MDKVLILGKLLTLSLQIQLAVNSFDERLTYPVEVGRLKTVTMAFPHKFHVIHLLRFLR